MRSFPPLLYGALTVLTSSLINAGGYETSAGGEYRYRNGAVQYETAENRGFTAGQIAPTQPLQFPRSRPAVPFNLPAPDSVPPATLKLRKIPVRLAEEAGVARESSPIRFGFPLPKGALTDSRNIRLADGSSRDIPAQFTPTSRWPDGSLKWVLVDSQLTFAPREVASLTLQAGTSVKHRTSASLLTLEQKDSSIIVKTGPLKAVIDKQKFNLLRTTWIDKNGDGTFEDVERGPATGDSGVCLTRPDGTVFTTAGTPPTSVTIEESGPERIVIRAEGKYAVPDGAAWMRYTTRLGFRAGSTVVDITHTHLNDDLSYEFTDLKSLELPLTLPSQAKIFTAPFTPVSGQGIPASAARLAIFQQDDRKSLWTVADETKEGGRATGQLSAGAGNFSLIVQDFWQRWPKSLTALDDNIVVGLLPGQPSPAYGQDLPYHLMFPFVKGNYRFKWGMSFTERLLLDLGGRVSQEQLAADAQLPIVAVLPAEWYEETAALGPISAPAGKQFAVIDRYVKDSFREHQALSDAQREYGFFNYGDWFGERKRNWGNNEYDRAHGFFQEFARSGNTGYFRLALQAARHQADVDIVHAYPDPYYVGSNHQHSIGHTGVWMGPNKPAEATWSHRYDDHTDAGNGHTWSDGMVDAWMLAGDAPVMEAAQLLGEHITWAMAPSFTRLGTHERSAGWSLKAILGLYRATADPAYLNAAAQIADVAIKSQTHDKGGAWAHKLPPDHSVAGETGNSTFLIGILLASLSEYHDLTGRPEALASVEAGAGWLLKAWNDAVGAWPYSAAPDGTPTYPTYVPHLNPLIIPSLAYLARVTGKAEYADVTRKALERTYWFGGPESIGKELAEALVFNGTILADLSAYYAKHDSSTGERVLDGEDTAYRDRIIRAIPEPGRQAVRGPRNRTFFVQLREDESTITAQRKPFGSALGELPTGKISLYGPDGTLQKREEFPSRDRQTLSFPLKGRAGDVYKIVVEDDLTAVWDVGGDGSRCVVETTPGLQLGGLNQGRLTFFVPRDTVDFQIRVRGIHHGAYGAAVLTPGQEIAAFLANSNTSSDLSIGAMPKASNAQRLTIRPDPKDTGKLWSIVLWAHGDAGCELSGVPPYLAFQRDQWFDPKSPSPQPPSTP